MALQDVGKEAAKAMAASEDADSGSGSSGTQDTDYERFDVSDCGFAKVHPGLTAIAGTAVTLRWFAPYKEDGEDLTREDRGWAGLIIDDPYIPDDDDLESVAIFESTDEKGDDYKVVNTEHDDVEIYDGVGVSVGRMFESEEVDEFSHDRLVVKLDTNAGMSVARALDVSGRYYAGFERTEDGEIKLNEYGYPEWNDGLIERCPDNDDDHYEPPQYIRDPQLRPDVEGRDVIIMMDLMENVVDDYSGNSHWATTLVDVEDDRQEELAQEYADSDFYEGDEPSDFTTEIDGAEFLSIAPTAEFSPDEDLVIETHYSLWGWLEDEELEQLRESQGITVSA